MSDFDAPKKPAWVGALVPVLLVLASAGLYWFFAAKGEGGGDGPPVDGSAQSLGTKLVNGKTYYLFASLIELYPKNLEGSVVSLLHCVFFYQINMDFYKFHVQLLYNSDE